MKIKKMDKIQVSESALCGLLASSIDTGDNNAFVALISSVTECNDPEWHLENLAHINYILSETLEYSGAFLTFDGLNETIIVNTFSKTVTYRLWQGKYDTVTVYYVNDGLGVDDYCKERYDDTATVHASLERIAEIKKEKNK